MFPASFATPYSGAADNATFELSFFALVFVSPWNISDPTL